MSNPLRILRTLDQHLVSPAELTLFGRSALALGYSQSPAHFHNTQDVDGILPLKMARADDDDMQDIRFMLRQEPLTQDQLATAFARARVPDVPEIQELFDRARPKVLDFAAT
jgi:hypothetical protein